MFRLGVEDEVGLQTPRSNFSELETSHLDQPVRISLRD